MPLIDHKIPIITGRNNIPTTSPTELNHPNGSFLTAEYNALIDDLISTSQIDKLANTTIINELTTATDELTTTVNELTTIVDESTTTIDDLASQINKLTTSQVHQSGHTIYVNSINGNNINNGLTSQTAVATIQKAIDILSAKQIDSVYINVTGVVAYTDPLDFFALQGSHSESKIEIILNINSYFNYSVIDEYGIKPSNTVNITFQNSIFDCTERIWIKNCHSLNFYNCEFHATFDPESEYRSLLDIEQSTPKFAFCTFNDSIDGITCNKSTNAHIRDCTFNNISNYAIVGNDSKITELDNTFVNCLWHFKAENSSFLQVEALPVQNKLVVLDNSICIVDGKLFTKATVTAPAIPNSITTTQLTTINNILTALRRAGIISI